MKRVLIMGAAGRDFHNFNVAFRDDPDVEVVAFTATQIPFIDDRTYPTEVAGDRYPLGIPIYPEDRLQELIRDLKVDEVVFSYSDVSYDYVMHRASVVLASGASFTLLGPDATMLRASVPVIAVCAVRTGAGKSQTTRAIADIVRTSGLRPVVVRHPMPYGDLVAERVQRFATLADLDAAQVTVEEREEYEHHIRNGTVVYAGVDYGAILEQAQAECDVLLWDGGNNDLPFYRPNLLIVVADPLRTGDERSFYPGEAGIRMADVVVINKMDAADPSAVEALEQTVRYLNSSAELVEAESALSIDGEVPLAGRRVLVVEDGPTLTHGNMKFGAGVVAAHRAGVAEVVDPRPFVQGTLKAVFEKYDVGAVLPAEGYSPGQLAELEAAIAATECDAVIVATPIDLRHLIEIPKPAVRVSYSIRELPDSPTLRQIVGPVLTVAAA
jgi:predicted GTPase